MKHGVAKRSSIFLLELIVAIMFFAIASGVCVRVFVASRVKSNKAAELNQAVMVCQTAGDIVYHSNGGGSILTDTFADSTYENGLLYAYFDSSWTPCKEDVARYVVKVHENIEGQLLSANIAAQHKDSGENIYSLNVTKYMPRIV